MYFQHKSPGVLACRNNCLYYLMPDKLATAYRPDVKGTHGSRALWRQNEGSEAYWKAVKAFLARHF